MSDNVILSEKQTEWIFIKVKEFTDKYISLLPLSDEQWKSVAREAVQIEHKSRKSKLAINLCIAALQYLEYADKEVRDGGDKVV